MALQIANSIIYKKIYFGANASLNNVFDGTATITKKWKVFQLQGSQYIKYSFSQFQKYSLQPS
jgi:hypothetical protein